MQSSSVGRARSTRPVKLPAHRWPQPCSQIGGVRGQRSSFANCISSATSASRTACRYCIVQHGDRVAKWEPSGRSGANGAGTVR